MENAHQALIFLLPPFLMCLILAGIHCYLGLHVLARGVIFVDLSLAQVAALGGSIAILLGYELHSFQAYILSLGATFSAAALFATLRKHEKIFSQEAIIGIVYALASAGVILVMDRTPHGLEHIKELLVGQLLWVTWAEVIKVAVIYSLVSAIHFIFRKSFIASSFGSKNNSGLWDFLFYALFGIVITSSVSIAGVLLVFAFLIVPSVTSTLFYSTLRQRLIFGWILGFTLSLIGMTLSYVWDLPVGAFIVACFTLVPVLLLIFRAVRAKS